MEKIAAFVTVLSVAVLSSSSTTFAGANCWTIKDADERALCRAVESNSAGQCSTISDFGARQACRARVSGNPSTCASLSSDWERRECRRQAGDGKAD